MRCVEMINDPASYLHFLYQSTMRIECIWAGPCDESFVYVVWRKEGFYVLTLPEPPYPNGFPVIFQFNSLHIQNSGNLSVRQELNVR